MEALKGVRILDMTHVQAGPTCSQLLAWMGADVIKFENPVGDATRGQLRDVPKADSLYFTMLNCNKRSITVNMKSAEGKQVFVDLLKKCDIIMENFGPGVLDLFATKKNLRVMRIGNMARLTGFVAQRVVDFVSHVHGDFIVGEVQLVQNAVKKSDLAPWHTKRVDLVGADQVNLPVPVSGTRVPFVAERNQLQSNCTQSNHLWMVVRSQRVFF